MRRRRIVRLGCIVALLAIPASCWGDGNAVSGYAGKIVTLRHAVGGTEIVFDEQGSTNSPACSWTVCGRILIRSARLRGNRIVMEGDRQWLGYDNQTRKFVEIVDILQGPADRKQRLLTPRVLTDAVKEVEKAKKVRIVIQRQGEWMDASARETLYKIFLTDGESLADVVGPEWKPALCATSQFAIPTCPPSDELPAGVFNVGGDVIGPKALAAPDPEYDDQARLAGYKGHLVLGAVVGNDGRVSHLEIVRPTGMGLDEKALAAVSQWTFKPGTRHNEPVPVHLNISVDFTMY